MSPSELHVIVGLGKTGLSCARYLQHRGVPFAIMDTRPRPPELDVLRQLYPETTVALGGLDTALLYRASHIVLSPGVALREPAIAHQLQRGVAVIGDIELFARAVNAPVIAITGTNAKSTVTTLVGKMAEAAGLQVQVGGNLGVPALDLLANGQGADLFVLELSSFQLETTHSLKPRVATVLNVTPDHMDRYTDFADYQRAKYRIYQHCQSAICNRDDPLTECNEAVDAKFYFTLNAPSAHEFGRMIKDNQTYLAFEDQPLLPVNQLPVMGKHYQTNALSALAIGYAFGLPFAPMLRVLREFPGLPHRCQLVREHDGVKWYNDSKGTNVGATQAAIEGLGSEIEDGKLVLIMGGVGKHADFTPLLPIIKKYARHVVLIGEAAQDLATVMETQVSVSFADTMDQAVRQAAAWARPADAVLLSPACASLDMFNNYEHRGRVFTEIVEKM